MEDNKRKNPWLGLESYREGEVLYGRDDDIRDLTQNVINDTDTLLYGKSGIGKSSILNAGVIPAARRHGFFPVLIRFSHKENESYLYQVSDAIRNAMIPIPVDEDGNQISLSEDEKRKREVALSTRIKEVLPCKDKEKESLYEYFHRHTFHSDEGERIKLLIIFDQFEEIFTLQDNEAKKKQFFSELADLLNNVIPQELQLEAVSPSEIQEEVILSDSDDLSDIFDSIDLNVSDNLPEYVTDNDVHLVFTIREDFLSEFEYYTASIPSLKQNRYGLRPINEEQAAQIIMRPVPGLVDEDVAKLIIEKVTGKKDFNLDGVPEIEVDSAVLSLYLNRLYEAKKEEKITANLVEEKGGEIIADFYSDAISNISDSTIEYLEDMLLNGKGRRDNITVFDAINDGHATEKELDILCNKKKILRLFNYAGDLRIEYVHDILCPVVKSHKDARLLIERQQEERQRQEEEKQRILQEEKAKREAIEQKAEEEKAILRTDAIKTRKRNQRRLYLIGSFVAIMLIGILGYYWRYEWEHESYFAQFERVNGWPVGVGNELTAEERQKTPLYYKLSHKGHLDHETDIEVMSSNGSLPLKPRISVFEVNDEDISDLKAMSYHSMLSKIAYIHFVEGENNKIDKEIAMDSKKHTLFVINYFHLSNGKEAWAQFVSPAGQSLKIRDNEIDRIKLSWYKNRENAQDSNNGRIESLMYFDANGICRPAANNICGYFIKFSQKDKYTYRYTLDNYGRVTQTSYNVVGEHRSKDSLIIKYLKVNDLQDSVMQEVAGPRGYSKEISVGNTAYLYLNSNTPVATLNVSYDKRGNIIEEKIDGTQPIPYPAVIKYSYSEKGYLTGIEKFAPNGVPFSAVNDSIYKKKWSYSDNGEVTLEEYWNVQNVKVYFHKVTYANSVIKDQIIDKRKDYYLTKIDTILPNKTITCYFGKDNKPITFRVAEGDDSLTYHKIIQEKKGNTQWNYYFTLGENNRVIPCPKVLNKYGKAISFSSKEQYSDNDGNILYYKLYDENGTIIKSMMRYYQNGQSVARAVMGVEGYGHPVRCPKWEEEGYAYFKIYYSKDFNNRYISINAVDEWENPSIFYDASANLYQAITYKDYKGANITFNGEKTNIHNSYSQYSLYEALNISRVSLPYLHILDKKSTLYKMGLRDGDRIVKLGSWTLGDPWSLLSTEWHKMYFGEVIISVLHPSAKGYTNYIKKVTNANPGCEEYHVYSLTNEEEKIFNKWVHLKKSFTNFNLSF